MSSRNGRPTLRPESLDTCPIGPRSLAPLLYLAASLAALAWVHRFRRLSRGAWVALLATPLLLTGPALLTGRVYAPFNLEWRSEPLRSAAEGRDVGEVHGILHDVATQVIPWNKAVRWSFGEREWPLLNPFMLCGDPLAGTAQAAPFGLLNLLALLVPLPWSLTLVAALRLFVAALGAFLLLRDLDCDESAALVGATGWILSSFVAFWLEWPLGFPLSLAPFLLFGGSPRGARAGAAVGHPARLGATRRGARRAPRERGPPRRPGARLWG